MSLHELNHPLGQDIHTLSSALQRGMADELPYWGLLKGFSVEVLSADDTGLGLTSLMLTDFNKRSTVQYLLAEDPEAPAPLAVIGEDEEGNNLWDKPVVARMVVVSESVLMPIGVRKGLPLCASEIQVDITEEGAVMTVNESIGINPIYGEYDGDVYGFIQRKSYNELRLGYVAQFAREYLAAA